LSQRAHSGHADATRVRDVVMLFTAMHVTV